ncbi:hypothetical protein L615_007000000130 [Nocardioides sp. J9]|uniref:hypothetical protein n=1 Tax=Nocardioides sp. J9 TaxID=935844 RepID=UPI0011A8B525|nr:hypothetical protein [Nocardioides sp. J9]TWG92502.1 hypothetical protein L615_007000000130 [Nocardioides sp. J9]
MRRPALAWSRRRWLVVGAVLAVVVAALAVVWVVRDDERTPLEEALVLAPESSARYGWTDWAAVRAEVGTDLSAGSTGAEVDDFLLEAYDRDLTSATALDDSAAAMQDDLGFSPATLEWELFAQGGAGALLVLGLPEDADVDALRERLREARFIEPDEDDGVWFADAGKLQELSGPVTPQLGAIEIDEDAGIVYASDDPGFLGLRADVARGDVDDPVGRAAAALGEPLAAVVYTGDHACGELAMSGADPVDRTRGAELIEDAGGVHPLTGFAMAARADGDVRVALVLDTDEQARADADSRSRLAAGPAPGQGGTFPERFELGRVTADGTLVTMDLTPVDGSPVISDLTSGPVLFAAC